MRQTFHAQFNKINRTFVTVIDGSLDVASLNQKYYLYRTVELDVEKEKIIGTYDAYDIVNIDSLQTEVKEDVLNALARDTIITTYPLEAQLSIIGQVLEKVADASGVECEDLKEMNDFIAEVRRANKIRKQFYAEHPDYKYVSTEEMQAMIDLMLEGGAGQYEYTNVI